ncbi:MAG: hypothetical protein IKI63_06240 [Clostridia bacterium]|nr:hypothetical protein [Clostridia bacterium]
MTTRIFIAFSYFCAIIQIGEVIVMTLTIERTTVDFDLEMTREYYKSHTVCDCCDDKNYQHFAKSRFPELNSFLSQFGVDISRPDETGPVYLEKTGTIQYLFVAYTVVGRIITEDQNAILLNASDQPIEVSINNEYYPNEQKGDYFSIVVTGIELPWLLEGEYPDKPKKALSHYKDIRGTLIKKRHCLFGNTEIFVISNDKETVSVRAGKGLSSMYPVGCKLTVGYIGRKLINIRPGIVYDDE